MSYTLIRIFFFLYVFLILPTLAYSLVLQDIASSVKNVQIKSLSQKIVNKDHIIFEGDVEILIHQKLHIWADYVFIDKKEQVIKTEGRNGNSVIVEDNNFLILTERFVFNATKKTGAADNLWFHLEEGFIFARHAEKLNDTDWEMTDVRYTACDKIDNHWYIHAERAVIHGSYFIKASNITCKIGDATVFWLPKLVFPIQGHSKSGFMIPRFAFDYDYGFGFKQEFYKYISPHCDTTLGVDWRDRKGIVFSDEFRWARSLESYTLFNAQYAIIRDRFVERHSKVVKGTNRQYWINAKDFRSLENVIGNADVNTLLRLDFGTDKIIGYHFFNNTNDVDDTFYNSLINRVQWAGNLASLTIENSKTVRKNFSPLNLNSQANETFKQDDVASFSIKELEDRVNVTYLPHVELNSTAQTLHNLFHYRHDLFFDQALYRQEEIERIYQNSVLIQESLPVPLHKADVIRLFYKGQLAGSIPNVPHKFTFKIEPTVQLVSHLKNPIPPSSGHNVLERPVFGYGAYRAFFEYGAEWLLPTSFCSTQALLTWNFLPKFFQEHWNYIDKWDRAYPKHEIACTIRNNWEITEDTYGEFNIKQGYDFYNQSDIFFLRRGVKQRHFLPLQCQFGCQHRNFYLSIDQEYELKQFDLLQSELNFNFMLNRVQCGIGYLFQKRELLKKRDLLSAVPHFIAFNLTIPLSNQMSIGYDGQFYASQRSALFYFDGITPLIHRIRLDYDGHCWGFYFGWEEKKYKEYGIGRNERAFVFSFRLDSLGSFAKKFRRIPQFVKNQ